MAEPATCARAGCAGKPVVGPETGMCSDYCCATCRGLDAGLCVQVGPFAWHEYVYWFCTAELDSGEPATTGYTNVARFAALSPEYQVKVRSVLTCTARVR